MVAEAIAERRIYTIGADFADQIPITLPTWRRDPSLFEVFDEFAALSDPSRNGRIACFRLGLPTEYVLSAQELVDSWGEQDKDVQFFDVERSDKPDVGYSLYRRGREEYVATVVPGTLRNDETILVDSLDHANQILQILFDMRNKRMAEWERRRAEEIASEPEVMPEVKHNGQVHGIIGSGIKPLRVFNVLPAGAVPISPNEDSGSSQAEVKSTEQ